MLYNEVIYQAPLFLGNYLTIKGLQAQKATHSRLDTL